MTEVERPSDMERRNTVSLRIVSNRMTSSVKDPVSPVRGEEKEREGRPSPSDEPQRCDRQETKALEISRDEEVGKKEEMSRLSAVVSPPLYRSISQRNSARRSLRIKAANRNHIVDFNFSPEAGEHTSMPREAQKKSADENREATEGAKEEAAEEGNQPNAREANMPGTGRGESPTSPLAQNDILSHSFHSTNLITPTGSLPASIRLRQRDAIGDDGERDLQERVSETADIIQTLSRETALIDPSASASQEEAPDQRNVAGQNLTKENVHAIEAKEKKGKKKKRSMVPKFEDKREGTSLPSLDASSQAAHIEPPLPSLSNPEPPPSLSSQSLLSGASLVQMCRPKDSSTDEIQELQTQDSKQQPTLSENPLVEDTETFHPKEDGFEPAAPKMKSDLKVAPPAQSNFHFLFRAKIVPSRSVIFRSKYLKVCFHLSFICFFSSF
jgi:hypothetical protein